MSGGAEPMTRGRLAGKAGVVTGGGSGLGRAVVEAACAEGASIVAVDVDAQAGRDTVDEINARGAGRAVFFEGDVREDATASGSIELCRSEFGSFDLFDVNAGVAIEKRLHETEAQDWDRILDINLKGAFIGLRAAVAAMRESGGGAIVITGSIASNTGDPVLPIYGTTKTGLVGLTRSIAVDYAEDGIRCNCICPGDMLTPMLQRTFDRHPDPDAFRAEMESFYPQKRIADPIEVARVVVFLLSDEASYMTGASVAVDGGLTAKCY